MPDTLNGLLELLRTVGIGPLIAAATMLILLRVATPDALRGAIGRIYGDLAPLVRDYWRARIDARQAEADRDRTIAEHWQRAVLAAHPKRTTPAQSGSALSGSRDAEPGNLGAAAPAVAAGEEDVDRCCRSHCPYRIVDGGDGVG